MKLVKLHEAKLDDETIYVSDVPMSAIQHVINFEESGNKDFVALGSLIKCVLKEKNGSPYKQFKDMTGEEIADAIPATSSVKIFEIISETALGKSIEDSKEESDSISSTEGGSQKK